MKIFHLPDLGEGLAEAEIRTWYVREGDTVEADQLMVSMETAKAVVDVPAPCSGKIIKLYGHVGENIKTHAPLVEFASDQGSVVGVLEESGVILEEPAAQTTVCATRALSVKVMPAVRALARELGIDLSTLTARGGHITADDVRAAAAQPETSAAHTAVEALHGVRRAMAQTMMRSGREAVPATLMDDADVTDCPLDFTVHLIQAMVAAAQTEPALNATFEGETLTRSLHHNVNLGLAMDSVEGLFVPVLKNAEACSASALRNHIDHLKQAVHDRSITPQELQGATLILSNFGTLAGRYASPVLVPPMVAILGCGKIYDGVVVKDGKMVIRRLAPLSLTFDHRAVTGGEASRFLAAMIRFLQGNA